MSDRTKLIDRQVALNRARMIAALKSGVHPQICGVMGAWYNEHAPKCFYGVAAYLFWKGPPESLGEYQDLTMFSRYVAAKLGTTEAVLDGMMGLNDGGVSFYQLGCRMERWPAPLLHPTKLPSTEEYLAG